MQGECTDSSLISEDTNNDDVVVNKNNGQSYSTDCLLNDVTDFSDKNLSNCSSVVYESSLSCKYPQKTSCGRTVNKSCQSNRPKAACYSPRNRFAAVAAMVNSSGSRSCFVLRKNRQENDNDAKDTRLTEGVIDSQRSTTARNKNQQPKNAKNYALMPSRSFSFSNSRNNDCCCNDNNNETNDELKLTSCLGGTPTNKKNNANAADYESRENKFSFSDDNNNRINGRMSDNSYSSTLVFKSLRKGDIKSAVRFVKDKWAAANAKYSPEKNVRLHQHRRQQHQHCVTNCASRITARSMATNRLLTCEKDVEVSLRYLMDVVTKERLLMLPGSAFIVLDAVLKFLAVLNERSIISRSSGLSRDSDDSISILKIYDEVYLQLAELLKHVDKKMLNASRGDKSESSEEAIICAGQNLTKSLKNLADQFRYNVDSKVGAKNNQSMVVSDYNVRNLVNNSLIKRSHSYDSRTSIDGLDFCPTDADHVFPQGISDFTDDSCKKSSNQPRLPDRFEQIGKVLPDGAYPNASMDNSQTSVDFSREEASENSAKKPGAVEKHFADKVSTNSKKPPLAPMAFLSPKINCHAKELNTKNLSPARSSDSGVGTSLDTSDDGKTGDEKQRQGETDVLTPVPQCSAKEKCDDSGHPFCYPAINSILGFDGHYFSSPTPVIQVQNDDADAEVDHQTFNEEREEIKGDKIIKTKKITTRQVIKKTFVTQKHTVIQTNFDDPSDLQISELSEEQKAGIADHLRNQLLKGDGAEVKTVETQNFTLSHQRKDADRTSDGVSGSVSKSPHASTLQNESRRTASPGQILQLCEKAYQETTSDENDEVCRLVTCEKNVIQQSRSVQSISRKALFNGQFLCETTEQAGQCSSIKASKSEMFKDGVLNDTSGSISYEEDAWETKDNSLLPSNHSDQCGLNHKKISGVLSYVQIFGNSKPIDETDFRATSLASYVRLSDRWRTHEETTRKKSMTFQFGSNRPADDKRNNRDWSSASPPHWTSNSWSAAFDNEKEQWATWHNARKFARIPTPRSPKIKTIEKQGALPECNFAVKLDESADFEIEATPVSQDEVYSQNFHESVSLSSINYLDEIDVKRFLILSNKLDTDDGLDIKGGVVDAIIVYATTSGTTPKGFVYQETFLTTYRTFISPIDLLKKLIYRYDKFFTVAREADADRVLDANKIVKNTFSLLVCVVDDLSPTDLNDLVLEILGQFSYGLVTSGQLNLARYLRQRLTRRIELKNEYSDASDILQLNRAIAPLNSLASPGAKITDFKSEMIAEQFTYLDWRNFKKIEPSEMLLWAQQQTEEHSPNLAVFTAHFNKMSYWVRSQILFTKDSKERECCYSKFLKVMHHLKRLGNFNSLFAMLSALDSGSIRRLDWSKTLSDAVAQYSALTDSSQSFKMYRQALAETKPPCLPYIGIILQDLTFVHVGNPNYLPESQCYGRKNIINMLKRWQQHTILDNMRRFKSWPYKIKRNDSLLAYLNDFADHASEEQLWAKSEEIKPRLKTVQTNDTSKKKERLVTS